MDISRFNKSDLYTILDISLKCATIDKEQDIIRLLDSIREPLPFEQAILTLVEICDENTQLQHYINHSYPQDWINCYLSNSFHSVDPVLSFSMHKKEPFLWRDIDHTPTQDNTDLFCLARDYGLEEGVSYAFGNGSGGDKKSLISIAGSKKSMYQIHDKIRVIASLLLPLIHDVNLRTFFRRKTNLKFVNLSGRERDVLAWTADGKSVEEIGKIMSISQDTVKYHMKNLNHKLNTVNKFHAVSTALRLGII